MERTLLQERIFSWKRIPPFERFPHEQYEHLGIVFLWGESYAASALAGFSVLDQFLSLRSSLTLQLAVVPVLLQNRRYFAERTEFFYLDVTSLANKVLPLPMGNKVSLVLHHIMFSFPGSISSLLAKLFSTLWVYKFWKCSLQFVFKFRNWDHYVSFFLAHATAKGPRVVLLAF